MYYYSHRFIRRPGIRGIEDGEALGDPFAQGSGLGRNGERAGVEEHLNIGVQNRQSEPREVHVDEYFFSTDVTMSAQQIIEAFTQRWSIEVTFEEVRCMLLYALAPAA